VEFTEWTADGVMRAPSFKGLRTDKAAGEVVLEVPISSASADGEPTSSDLAADGSDASALGSTAVRAAGSVAGGRPEDLFDELERLPGGDLIVLTEGRQLKLSNWDKVLFPQTGFTKGDLISYYARVAPALLAHLRDRPLTLKRYPNGVEAPYFYEKQSPSHRPEWVRTETIKGVSYTIVDDRPTLIWLANLADLELHTSLALATAPGDPTMVAFDLDPGDGAGLVECAEVALVLRGLFGQLGLETRAKTSGSKGMQVYLPLGHDGDYAVTKPFARTIAELLEARMPELVVSRMTKRLRPGRVLVDWSQNDVHKTTVTVYSVRARPRPTVSTPLLWEEVQRCHSERNPSLLTFETEQVLARIAEHGDLFADVVTLTQQLPVL
jgi:bifunctional non-homologous end joining protein LigD